MVLTPFCFDQKIQNSERSMCQAQISTSDPKPLLNAGPWQPGPWVFGGPSQQGPFGFYRAVTTGPWIKTDVCSYKRKAFCFLFRPFILRACFMHFLNGQKVETSNSLFSLFLKRWGIICFFGSPSDLSKKSIEAGSGPCSLFVPPGTRCSQFGHKKKSSFGV